MVGLSWNQLNGLNWDRLDWKGLYNAKVSWNEPNWAGNCLIGLELAGICWNALYWVLNWSRLGENVLDMVDWTGLGWNGLEWQQLKGLCGYRVYLSLLHYG